MQLRDRAAGFVRTEGGLLPPDLLERIRSLDPKLPFLDPSSYDLASGQRFGEAITRSWNRLVGAWKTFSDELARVPANDPATTPSRERWLLPLMEEVGYGRLSPTKAVEIEGKSYPISHARDTIPLHLVGANVPLDRRSKGVAGAAGQSPHGLLQEFLNRTPDRLWGIVTNGRTLRILRDNASLTRQAYVEFDLEAIFAEEAYADFALLWHLAHRSRLEARTAEGAEEDAARTAHGAILERWSKVAEETGARARDRLRDGVQEAIEALGSGFLAHPVNTGLRAALQGGELDTQDYYRELLRLVYRLILLFVAEDRDLLLDPRASPETRERYTRYYSTGRLRRLAGRRKGSRHADLFAGLRVVVAALGNDEGAPGIGLPPLGGFLFGPEACPHLDGAELANAELLDAVRKLATIEERAVLRAVDYRNLGSEELGSIYESLLELHPELDVNAATFALGSAAGHERKTTGSYYTPSSLISVLLDSALDPVLAEAADKPTPEEAERAILELSVVDPAAGSGHFLVAAAHRIAKRLAQVRSGDEEPAPTAIRTALRDVIGHCLYAVDINPMAVELCKVSLWLEALEPGKPLNFLDAHIKCGNSLLGATPELIAAGIPDAAYTPIEGDDKVVAAALKKRNRAEREGQLRLDEVGLELRLQRLAEEASAIDALLDTSISTVREKERRHTRLSDAAHYRHLRSVGDAWCLSFFLPKTAGVTPLTTATLRKLAIGDKAAWSPEPRAVQTLGLFHWEFEFPQVVHRGGFDVVLGNPPWDQVQLDPREFFAVLDPQIADAPSMAARDRLVAKLAPGSPVAQAYQSARRSIAGLQAFLHGSGLYPLGSRGRLNTAPLFLETGRRMIRDVGRVGLLVPSGIATDSFTQHLFQDLIGSGQLVSFFSFENEEFIFPEVHHAFRFAVLTLAGRSRRHDSADFAFYLRSVMHLDDPERHFQLTDEDIRLLNPNTRTASTFRSKRDAALAKRIAHAHPALVDREQQRSDWQASSAIVFMSNIDSHLFETAAFPGCLPLIEGKMIHQFDHRSGTYEGQTEEQANQGVVPAVPPRLKRDPEFQSQPRYWVASEEVSRRLRDKTSRPWILCWRDITSAATFRTTIVAALPAVGTVESARILLSPHKLAALLIGVLNSFVVDWFARQKVGGTHLSFFILEQLAIISPNTLRLRAAWGPIVLGDWLRGYVTELVVTSGDLLPFGNELGWNGPPFVWDDERRPILRAEVDAACFHLYGVTRDDVEHVMQSFWIVREKDEKTHGYFRTKTLILEAYDAMAVATLERPFVSRLSPGPGDPSAAHPPAAGKGFGHWLAWEDVVPPESPTTSSLIHPQPRRRSRARQVLVDRLHDREPDGWKPADAESAARDERSDGFLHPSFSNLIGSLGGDEGWQAEEGVDPSGILLGSPVRHRSMGEGVVLSVRAAGKGVSLLIRFASGEREIAFGHGFLEFMR